MGSEPLIDYLSNVVTEARVYLMKKAYDRLLLQFGDAFSSDIETLLDRVSDQDYDTQLSLINQQTIDWLCEAIKKYGVEINREAVNFNSINTLSELLSGFIECDNYEDPKQLYTCLEKEGFTDDALLEMFEIYTNCSMTEYMEVIEKISDNVVPNLVEVLVNLMESNDTLNDTETEYYPIPPQLISLVKNPETQSQILDRLLQIIIRKPVHLDMDSLLRVYGNGIGDLGVKGVVSWVVLVLYSKENDINLLHQKWSPYFLEESDIVQCYTKTKQLYDRITGGNQ